MQIDFSTLEQALQTLNEAHTPPPRNDRERDGAIQRFEYTFELTWKVAKKALGHVGIISESPRSVIRDMAQQGWIDDAALWLEFLDARNLTSHTYKRETANEVFEVSKKFATECGNLILRIKNIP